ncbi:hypothetical protein LINGRAHAP2_LOCUS29141 [Linum grandiflorum]
MVTPSTTSSTTASVITSRPLFCFPSFSAFLSLRTLYLQAWARMHGREPADAISLIYRVKCEELVDSLEVTRGNPQRSFLIAWLLWSQLGDRFQLLSLKGSKRTSVRDMVEEKLQQQLPRA